MFSVYCPTHRTPVLLWSDCITALTNTPRGVLVQWRCSCGDTGTWDPRAGHEREAA